jgi:hypothetical protein
VVSASAQDAPSATIATTSVNATATRVTNAKNTTKPLRKPSGYVMSGRPSNGDVATRVGLRFA